MEPHCKVLLCYLMSLENMEKTLFWLSHFYFLFLFTHVHLINTIINIGPYDFHDVENMDGIAESSHKNGIYCIMQNVAEFAKFWTDKSKVGKLLLNQNAIWTSVCEY